MKKNIITRAIGVNSKVMADFFEVELSEREAVLLCSDGLTNMIEEADIFHIINHKQTTTKEKVLHLIELANKNGGRDNIAVVLVEQDEVIE